MTPGSRALLAAAALAALAAASPATGAGDAPATPGARDKCPVCGMFVARYPDWVAGARLADGTLAFFDGPKDLFRFWLAPEKYVRGRTRKDVAGAFVTDYYAAKQVDARAAWYVMGSDVLGPMGHELVPFATEAAAREFMNDHKGRRVLRFDEIDAALLQGLG